MGGATLADIHVFIGQCCSGVMSLVFMCVCFILFSLITSRVEVNILRSINPHFAKIKVQYVVCVRV